MVNGGKRRGCNCIDEGMLSQLIFSLYLAHLKPCDNNGIDLNLMELANSEIRDVGGAKAI